LVRIYYIFLLDHQYDNLWQVKGFIGIVLEKLQNGVNLSEFNSIVSEDNELTFSYCW
jgi:hypothetical protein